MKPTYQNIPSKEELDALEAGGHTFDTHDGKRIVGKAIVNGYSIEFLEDDSEIMRAPDGTFIEQWPEVL